MTGEGHVCGMVCLICSSLRPLHISDGRHAKVARKSMHLCSDSVGRTMPSMQNQQSHKGEAVLASEYDYGDLFAEGWYSRRMQRRSYLSKRRKLSFLLHQRGRVRARIRTELRSRHMMTAEPAPRLSLDWPLVVVVWLESYVTIVCTPEIDNAGFAGFQRGRASWLSFSWLSGRFNG